MSEERIRAGLKPGATDGLPIVGIRSRVRSKGGAALRARLIRAAAGTLALILAQSLFWMDQPEPLTRIIFAGFVALACIRPDHALLALAGLSPIAFALSDLAGVGATRLGEALVLATLTGWLLGPGKWLSRVARTFRSASGVARTFGSAEPAAANDPPYSDLFTRSAAPRATPAAHGGPARPPAFTEAASLFALIVLASIAVSLTIVRTTWRMPTAFGPALLRFLTREYLAPGGAFDPIVTGLLLIEGVALMLMVAAMCRDNSRWPLQMLRMSIAGGIAAACLSGLRLSTAFLRTTAPADVLGRVLRGDVRLSLHVPDVNAAGSYFVMMALVAIGMAAASRRRDRWAWLVAAFALATGLGLSGSRAAIVAGLAVLLAASGLLVRALGSPRLRGAGRKGLALTLTLAAILVAAFPQVMLGPRSVMSLMIRVYFLETSLRMLATHPVFGVGLGNYVALSSQFMPDALNAIYAHENAHNYFLQIAAELGLAGAACFCWIIGAPLWAAVVRLQHDRRIELGAVVAGLIGFLITCLSGHPLLLPAVAYPFWMLMGLGLGLAAERPAGAAHLDASSTAPVHSVASHAAAPAQFRSPGWVRAGAIAAALIVAASIPYRARAAIRTIDLSRVSRGFYDWETARGGIRFRWTGREATFFVARDVRAIGVPLRALHTDRNHGPTTVAITIDGRDANRLQLIDSNWVSARFVLPPAGTDRFRRIELHVTPTWSPADSRPNAPDRRELGVMVGEIRLTR